MERDKFIQERSDKKLLGFDTDSQGNKNYSKVNKIYTSLSSKKVKVFYKDLWYWDNLEVYLLKLDDKQRSLNKGLGCWSKRTSV